MGLPPDPYDVDVVTLALDRAEETVAAIAPALDQTGVLRHVFVLDRGSQPAALVRIAAAVEGRNDATLVAPGIISASRVAVISALVSGMDGSLRCSTTMPSSPPPSRSHG